MLIANSGKVIRMAMDSIRIIGRNTQGVRLINLDDEEKVVGMSMLARETGVDKGEEDYEAAATDESTGDK